jgi:hypothetical protein
MPYISYEDSGTQKGITNIIKDSVGISEDDLETKQREYFRSRVDQQFFRWRPRRTRRRKRPDYSEFLFRNCFRDRSPARPNPHRPYYLPWDIGDEDEDLDVPSEIREAIKEYLNYEGKEGKLPLHPRR